MILDEAHHALLISRIGQQVLPHALGVLMLHAVVEFLVVAEIKALLLQFPLQIPVGFGDELELGRLRFDRGDHVFQ